MGSYFFVVVVVAGAVVVVTGAVVVVAVELASAGDWEFEMAHAAA